MRKDRESALKMRLSGKSYSEISKALEVSKSTLSAWLGKIELPLLVREEMYKRTNKKALEALLHHNKGQTTVAVKRMREIRKISAQTISNLTCQDLLMLGIALYWAEGYKRVKMVRGREVTSHPISLTNSDPALVKCFLRFIREICEVSDHKIKASIRVFEHQNEKHLLDFWRKETNIPKDNFKKTYYGISKSSEGKRPFNRLEYGVIQISIADTNLFHKIMGYIEGIKKLV